MPGKTPKVPSTTEAILRLPLLDENNKLLRLGNTQGKFQFPETTELEAVTGAKKYRDFASRADGQGRAMLTLVGPGDFVVRSARPAKAVDPARSICFYGNEKKVGALLGALTGAAISDEISLASVDSAKTDLVVVDYVVGDGDGPTTRTEIPRCAAIVGHLP